MKSKDLSVVLVHGAFVDGSGWEAVHALLTAEGYQVRVVQNATRTLADDVALTKGTLASLPGRSILVGHSYGGAVISEASRDEAKVAGLVYVAAFVPDQGESIASLIKDPPPGAPVPPILPPRDGGLYLDRAGFHQAFAGDIDAKRAAFLADAQPPWNLEAFAAPIGEPGWKKTRSWYLLTTEDHMIPPAAQRAMATRAGATIVEEKASHAVFLSRPEAVAALIRKAAEAVSAG